MGSVLFQITVAEAAKELDISQHLLRAYIRAGVFKSAFKHKGTRWILDRQEIELFKKGKLRISGCFRKKK